MNRGCVKNVWMLDPHNKNCPKELKDEIFDKIVRDGEMSNDSVTCVSINILKEQYNDEEDLDCEDDEHNYNCPLLIKYLEDNNFDEDEDVYIHIWW